MTLNDTAQVDPRAVQPDEIPFALITIGHDVPKLKPGVLKTYASIVCHSILIDGTRSTIASNREIAGHTNGTPKPIGSHVQELEGAGLVTASQNGRVRTITINEPKPDKWVRIRMDHPVWKMPDRAFKVFFGLKWFRGSNRIAWMTNQTLGEFLGMSERNIKYGIETLKSTGLIVAKYEWHGCKRYRRVFFTTLSQVDEGKKVPIEDVSQVDEGKKVPIEDVSQKGYEGKKVPIEDVSQKEAAPGQGYGQKSSLGEGIFVPHYGQKSSLGEGIFVPIEEECIIEKEEKNTHTAHARTHEAEHQTPAGVCVSERPSSEPKTKTPAERFFAKIEWTLKSKVQSVSARARIEEAIISAWNQNGYISEQFVKDCFSVVNKETIYPDKVVIKEISKWAEFSQKTRDKMMEQKEIQAREYGYWPMTEDEQTILSEVRGYTRKYLIDMGYVEEINGIWWILRDSHHWINDAMEIAREYSEEQIRKAKSITIHRP